MNLKEYFTDTNYVVIYTYSFFSKFANSLVKFFTGAYFLSLGMPLSVVLLFFALEYGIKGLFAPFGPKFASSLGVIKAMVISNVSLIFFFILMNFSKDYLYIGFFAFIFHAFYSGISVTVQEGLQSKVIKNKNRGRQLSLSFVIQSLAALLAVYFGTIALQNFSYLLIVIVGGISISLSTASFLFLKNIQFNSRLGYAQIFRQLRSKAYKKNYFPMFGQTLALIANTVFLPIFIYLSVGNFKTYGTIIFVALLVEIFMTLIFGRLIDRLGARSMNIKTAGLNSLGNIGLMVFQYNQLTLLFANIFNQISWNLYFNNALVRQFNKAKRYSFTFMTLIKMNICFVGALVLGLFALISVFIGENISFIIFFSAMVGMYIFSKYFKD